MSKYSKNKGSGYERHVSSLLDKWYGVPPKTFWRSRVSGAWVEPGDIVSRDKALTGQFPFVVECKFQKGLNLWSLVNNSTKNWFTEFWKQLDDEGKGKTKLLIFKTNRTPDYVSFDKAEIEWYTSAPKVEEKFKNFLVVVVDGRKKIIVLWSEFARVYEPKMFVG